MNHRNLIVVIAISATSILGWSVRGAPASEPDGSTESVKKEETGAIQRMKAEQKLISERLHITAPMEIEFVNGIDPVMEAYENGFIIEATLEQVEAALDAAANTPDEEDDLEALELKHRGSYRFFSSESDRAHQATSEPK